MTTLASKIINSHSEIGIPGLYIEAWEVDKRYHDPLGAATTGNDGSFQISFEDADFRDEAIDSRPQIFFRVYHEHRLIKTTENDPISITESTEIPPFRVDLDLNGRSADTFRVSGRVAHPDGRGIPGLLLYGFHKTTRDEIWLSGAKTNQNGEYLIYYQSSQLTRKPSADLVIKVYRTIRDASPLVTSPLVINALDHEVINLVVGEVPYRGLDLYAQIHEKLAESLQEVSIREMRTTELFLLANAHDLDVQDVFRYIQARRWSEQWN